MRGSLIVGLFLLLGAGCGGSQTPQEMLGEANKAFTTTKDYDQAITLYKNVLDWKGEGEPTTQQRFEASFNLARCQVRNKEFDRAVASMEEIQKAFGDTVTYKNYCTVIVDLVAEKASGDAIDLLGKAKELYPKYEDQFEKMAEKIKKLDLSDEEMQKLQSLGYL